MILAGDIGGTNTRLAFFEQGKMVEETKKFSSQKHQSLEEIVEKFLNGKKVEKACFGVAGPVREGKSKVTNLSWVCDEKKISQRLQIPSVHILNDLEANAWGLKAISKEDLEMLQKGKKEQGNRALIAAGTGLGEAGLIWNGMDYLPFACEGGHVDFGPRDELEIELFSYLKKKFSHVSYERVLSGPGLCNLFHFLIDTGREKLNPEVQAEMKKTDPAKVISSWGKENRDLACTRAVDWFISIYGSESGNLVLKFLALGGLFIGGGIAPNLIQKMKSELFLFSFSNKGRFKELLENIPISVIMKDDTALLGAAYYAEKVQK